MDAPMQPLAVMFFLILAELAVGGLLLVVLVDYEGIATKGFLGLAAVTYALTGLAAWWARAQMAAPPGSPGLAADQSWLWLEGLGLIAFLAGTGLYALLLFGTDRRLPRLAGTVAVAGGLVSLLASGLAYRAPHLAGLSTVLSILTGALVLGAAMSGMILGHWYLVTPGLSPRPLRTMTLVLIVALALQTALIPVFLLASGPAAAGADAATLLSGGSGISIAFWLRVLVGLVLPLAVAGMTWQCCRIRALQSATGLLYVAVALVLAGEIAAKLLLVLAAMPL
jgi:DMSO reductase anchor subunit